MKTELSKIDKTKIYFTADNADEIFLLGQLKQIFPLSEKGFSLDCKVSLGIDTKELLQELIRKQEVIYED